MTSKSDRLGIGPDYRILDTLEELSGSDFNPSKVAGQGPAYFPWVSPRVIDIEALQASGCAL